MIVEPEALAARPRPTVSSRFDFVSLHDEALRQTRPRSRRVVQGVIVMALVAAAASLLVVLPDGDDTVAAAGERPERIETEARPEATAEMLTSARSEVDGSLQSLASTGRLSRASIGQVPRPGTPGDNGDGFATAVAEVVAEIEVPPPSPTTTAWTEPTMPPESDWVDSGNGVMVPDLLLRIRFCESTNNYAAANPSSSARGAYQFLNKSWDWYGHAATTGVSQAHLATPAQQDRAAFATLKAQGTGPWAESRSCWADKNIDPRYATASPRPRPPATATTVVDSSSTTDTGESSTTSTSEGSNSSTTDTTGQGTTSTPGETTTTTESPTTSTSAPTSSTQQPTTSTTAG